MTETAHKSFFRTPKVLALLPLILMAAGVWYYVAKRGGTGPAPAPVSADFNFGNPQSRTAPEARDRPVSLEVPFQRPLAHKTASKAPAQVTRTPPKADGSASLNNSFAEPRLFEAPGESTGAKEDGPVPEYGPFITEAALEVKGDADFKRRVMHSLKLIWLSDREDFLFIKKYISVIRNEDKTEFYLDNGRPVAALSKAQANRSLTWCAGLIAHQAFHAYIKFNSPKKQKVRPPLPGDKDERKFFVNPAAIDYTSLNSILNMEARACSFQVEMLRKIGAPRPEINALLKRAPRDFSVSHDGNYSIK